VSVIVDKPQLVIFQLDFGKNKLHLMR